MAEEIKLEKSKDMQESINNVLISAKTSTVTAVIFFIVVFIIQYNTINGLRFLVVMLILAFIAFNMMSFSTIKLCLNN